MKFKGVATVIPASEDTNPDAYLCIGEDNRIIRVGSKNDPSMQEMADALNEWAGQGQIGLAKVEAAGLANREFFEQQIVPPLKKWEKQETSLRAELSKANKNLAKARAMGYEG